MSSSGRSGGGNREVAYRVFAAEYEAADRSFSESEEDRAPNYVITPTGARINRLFVVGVLTEVEQVGEDFLRARVVDPTGAFVLYAGQYQPDEQAFLERADPPTFVAVTGKANTFQPDDSDQVFTSVKPESINEVDAETRDRWNVQAASHTIERVDTMASALAVEYRGTALKTALVEAGVDEALAQGIALALDHYETTPTYLVGLRELAVDAARLVAGQREEVEGRSVEPDDFDGTTPRDVTDTLLDLPAEPPVSREETVADDVAADRIDETTEQPISESTDQPEVETAAGEMDSASERTEDSVEDQVDGTVADPDDGTVADTDDGTVADTDDGTVADTADETAADSPDTDEELGDFSGGEFELEDEDREEIENEYGTEFKTGTEVEPGERSEVDSPDASVDESPAAKETVSDSVSDGAVDEGQSTEDGEPDTTAEESDTPTEESESDADGPPDDLQGTVVSLMKEFDDGDGADRAAVIEAMEERHGLADDVVEEAIQDALMDGECYEPGEDRLKPI